MKTVKCKVCSNNSEKIFEAILLSKYNVSYYQCESCDFIQTEDPFWLDVAYGSAIGKLDIGLIYRNIELSNNLEKILLTDQFDSNAKFLDYGGGYGMFVRMMRDKGFDFFRQDIYCENLFAEFFDIKDLNGTVNSFEVLTAFEVFEHLVNPLDEIAKMLSYTETIIFSTELIPQDRKMISADDWWYFAPEGGQHIAFYSLASLQEIAKIYNLQLFSNGYNLHVLTKKNLLKNPLIFDTVKPSSKSSSWITRIFEDKTKPENVTIKKRESLLGKDFEYIKSLINK
ncbi:class I SAM-dependent methyltransferase [Chryseobacterium binzhouense]|uniref:class I SAM-dependent methyltransferase n=1 Tax=Chryseobacterium binzhouense TaxID=2593646 RepID=UPI00117EC270|nr:class I SAM-dependent methyltransferase [Chryseobacterium binzhouense]